MFYLDFGCLFGPMATNMDTSGPLTEGSPPVVPPVVTSPTSVHTDEAMGHLVAIKIQEYCEGKLIDDHDQFQRIKMQCNQLMSMYAKHDGHLDTHECKLIVFQAYQNTDKIRSTTASAKPEKFKDKSKVTILAWLAQMHKYLTTRQVPSVEWVVIASTYLETNVAQHWDVLAMELRTDKKDPLLWDNFQDALITAIGSVNQ